LHLRYYKNVLAEDGETGGNNNRHGKDGKDIIIDVPLGTIARDEETGEKMAEILEDGQEIILLSGGKGGLGIPILPLQPTRHQSMLNRACRVLKDGKCLN
jgi:GTP-binding protein